MGGLVGTLCGTEERLPTTGEEGSWPERCSSWRLAFTLSAIQIASFLGRKVKKNSAFPVLINIKMDHIKYIKY